MTSPTPEERTYRADTILQDYRRTADPNADHELVELLCDLMHWADAANLDFPDKIWEAEHLFEARQKSPDLSHKTSCAKEVQS